MHSQHYARQSEFMDDWIINFAKIVLLFLKSCIAEEILTNMIRPVYITWKGRVLFLQRVTGFHPFITHNSRNLSRSTLPSPACPEQGIPFIFSTGDTVHPDSFQASCLALPCFPEHLTEMRAQLRVLQGDRGSHLCSTQMLVTPWHQEGVWPNILHPTSCSLQWKGHSILSMLHFCILVSDH